MKNNFWKSLVLISITLQFACAAKPSSDDNNIPPAYKAYYGQVKEKLATVWPDLIAEKFKKIRSEGLTVAPKKGDCKTLVGLQVSPTGTISETKLLKPCGIKFADDAALEAFAKVATLPAPPPDIVKDGVAVLRWGFIVQTKK